MRNKPLKVNQAEHLRLFKGKSMSAWLCQLALVVSMFSLSFGMIEMAPHSPSMATTELVVSTNRVHKPRVFKIVKPAKFGENLICPPVAFKLAILYKSGTDNTAFYNLATKRLLIKPISDYSLIKLNTTPLKETPNYFHQG